MDDGDMEQCSLDNILYGYREKALKLRGRAKWFIKLEWLAHLSDIAGEALVLLNGLNDIVKGMAPDECLKLKTKVTNIVPANAKGWRESYNSRLREIVIEMLGWEYLHQKYPDATVTFMETPDLLVRAQDGCIVAAMECKKYNLSKLENKLMRPGGPGRGGSPPIQPARGWYAKVDKTIKKAKEQLQEASDAREKLIFISFSHDVDIKMSRIAARELGGTWAYDGVKEHLKRWAVRLKTEGIDLVAFEGFSVDKRMV